jgi:hypothetical protein
MLMVAEHDQVIGIVRKHADLIEVFRLMKDRLNLTNEFIDDVGGLTKGHADKILGPSESKNIGPVTFDLFCQLFAVEFHVRLDMDAVKRMEAVWEKRERPLYPNAKVKRISKKLVQRAKPYVLRDNASLGGKARANLLTSKQVARIARKGAHARRKKLTKSQRVEIARNAGIASAAKRKAIALQQLYAIGEQALHCGLPAQECLLPSGASIAEKPLPIAPLQPVSRGRGSAA